ncbi:MAG: TrmH family RNA methyltransferase [Acidimicrobiales bacterium]
MALYDVMVESERIESRGDPRLADYVDLRAGLTPDSVVIAEGLLAVEQLATSRYPIRSVLTTPRRLERLPTVDAPVYVVDENVLRATVGFNLHRGVVAAADRPPLPDPASLLGDRVDRVAVLEGVNDHENLGGLFRNARAFGIHAVLLDPTTADPLYRRSVRVSMGHVLHVPFARLEPWPEQLALLHERGFTTVALTPLADAEPIDEVAAAAPERTAFLLGAEGPGLSPGALAAVDRWVRVPISRDVDSLNVATAAAIAFHTLTPRDP